MVVIVWNAVYYLDYYFWKVDKKIFKIFRGRWQIKNQIRLVYLL